MLHRLTMFILKAVSKEGSVEYKWSVGFNSKQRRRAFLLFRNVVFVVCFFCACVCVCVFGISYKKYYLFIFMYCCCCCCFTIIVYGIGSMEHASFSLIMVSLCFSFFFYLFFVGIRFYMLVYICVCFHYLLYRKTSIRNWKKTKKKKRQNKLYHQSCFGKISGFVCLFLFFLYFFSYNNERGQTGIWRSVVWNIQGFCVIHNTLSV